MPAIASSWVSPKVSTDGSVWVDPGAAGFGLNQQIVPNDFVRFEEGVVRPWENIREAYVHGVPGDGQFRQLRLILTAGVGATLAADAVRIERVDSTNFQYDANGNLLKEIDPLDRETTYAYDELDRIVTETRPILTALPLS